MGHRCQFLPSDAPGGHPQRWRGRAVPHRPGMPEAQAALHLPRRRYIAERTELYGQRTHRGRKTLGEIRDHRAGREPPHKAAARHRGGTGERDTEAPGACVPSRPGLHRQRDGGRHRQQQRLGHELRRACQQRPHARLCPHRPHRRHHSRHGQRGEPRGFPPEPSRIPEPHRETARQGACRREATRAYNKEVPHQERDGTQPAPARGLRRPLRHHRPFDSGQRGHTGLPLRGDDEDLARLSLSGVGHALLPLDARSERGGGGDEGAHGRRGGPRDECRTTGGEECRDARLQVAQRSRRPRVPAIPAGRGRRAHCKRRAGRLPAPHRHPHRDEGHHPRTADTEDQPDPGMPGALSAVRPRRVHRGPRCIWPLLGHPLGHLPQRGRHAPHRHLVPHRGCRLPHRIAARGHGQAAEADRGPRLHGCLHLRPRLRGQLSLHPEPELCRRARGGPLCRDDARRGPACGWGIRWFAEGRARHGPEHGSLRAL